MHWAVRGKKDLMLEEAAQTHTKQIENEKRNEQRERKEEEMDSTTEQMKQKECESPDKFISQQNPDSPGKLCQMTLQNREGLKRKGLVYIALLLKLFQPV